VFPDLQLVFVGDKRSIQTEFNKHPSGQKLSKRFSVTHASEVITMDESPS
jgi:fatty acid/phospholipid biosynthesis enzyme